MKFRKLLLKEYVKFSTIRLCGAHTLVRVGEMKSQKIQKSALFDSVDENGVLAKCVEHGWSFRSYSKH